VIAYWAAEAKPRPPPDAVAVDAKFDGIFDVGDRGRVLVLVDPEHPAQGGRRSTEAPGPAERVAFLQDLLEAAGWSHTIVHDRHDFATELRSGTYQVYLLDAADVHLAVQVQHELREAVYRGEGLVFTGAHDSRNGHLWDVVGVSFHDEPDWADGLDLLPSAVHAEGGTADFLHEERVLRASADDAVVIGYFSGGDRPALAKRDYGFGRTVYAGFDLVGQATAAGADKLFAETILGALDHVHGEAANLIAGGTLPVRFELSLTGEPAEGRLRFGGDPVLSVTDPGLLEVGDADVLEQAFALAHGEMLRFDYWLHLGEDVDVVRLHADVDRMIDGTAWHYGRLAQAFDIPSVPDIADIRAAVDTMQGSDWRSVAQQLANVERELERGRADRALTRLVNAAGHLERITGAAPDDIRRDLGWLMHHVARQVEAGPSPDDDPAAAGRK
jgi:hypothetical protein